MQGVAVGEGRIAFEEADARILFQVAINAFDDALYYPVLARDGSGEVESNLAFYLDSKLAGATRQMGDLSRPNERLGRDAAFVDSGATDLALLNQRDRRAEIGSHVRGRQSALSAADDDHIKFFQEGFSLCWCMGKILDGVMKVAVLLRRLAQA